MKQSQSTNWKLLLNVVLLEIRKNFLDHGVVEPVDDDLFLWHGNVRLCDADGQEEAVYHFAMGFTKMYPSVAPVVRFLSPVPHPNVQANGVFCCELLGNTTWAHDQLVQGESGWSSAYSPFSVLLTLVSMRGELLPEHNGVTPAQAAQLAREFECGKCRHHGTKRETPCIADASKAAAVEVFIPPKVTLLVAKEIIGSVQKAPVAEKPVAEKPVVSENAAPPAVVVVKSASATVVVVKKKKAKKDDGWVVVGKEKKPLQQKQEKKPLQQKQQQQKQQPQPQKKASAPSKDVEAVPVGWMDEVELKRQKEKARKKLKRQQAAMELKKQEEAKIQKEAEKRAKKKQMAAKKIVAVAAPVAVVSSFSSSSKSKPVPMGMFAKMPADVLAYILRMLSVHDVLRCALVSKGFERVAKNAFLWKDLYAREFPQSSIKQMGDFRHAYTLRLQGVVSELVCFHTKVNI